MGTLCRFRRTTLAAVALVAAVAAAVSYAHMRELAYAAGEDWRSWLVPLSVDGLLVAAAMSMLVARRAGRAPSRLAWASLSLGIGASLAANVAAAEPTLAGRLVAAWPPVALALAFELLMQQGLVADHASAKRAPNVPAPPAPKERPAARSPKRGASARTTKNTRSAQEKARALFERAVRDGNTAALTGAAIAAEVGAHPSTARRWLADWRAKQEQAESPRLAVVGEAGGGN